MNKRRALLAPLAFAAIAFSLSGCGDEASGDPCEMDADCPTGEVCGEEGACVCPPEGCSSDNNDTGGITKFGFTGDGSVSLVNLGSLEITGEGSEALTVSVPSGSESVAIVMEGAGSNLTLASKITSPSGTVVYDFNEDIYTNRTDANDGLYTVLIPSNTAVDLESGDWQITFLSGGNTFTASFTGVIKTKPASANTLDVNLFFVGVDGLDAATAETDTNFQSILSNVESIYGGAGISFGNVSYIDVSGSDADTYGVIDSIDGPSSELARLFQLSKGQTNRAINFFFVADIGGGDAGFTLLGLAGGVPGPPALHGTTRSGVAVNMADFIEAKGAADADMIAEASGLVELIMAHEAGHYLGLYHTTERNGQALDANGILGQDPLSDTPTCDDGSDANGDKRLSSSECADADGGNLMFWSPGQTSRSLTSQQGTILSGNPVVK